MIKIFSGEEINALYTHTIQHEGLPLLTLIENAATKLAEEFLHVYKNCGRPIVCIAGNGDNGADALALSLELASNNYAISVFLIQGKQSLSSACETMRNRVASHPNIKLQEVISGKIEFPVLTPKHIVIDGLFGTGLNRTPEGAYRSIIQYINQSQCEVVSIDLPSGLYPSENLMVDRDAIIKATYTYTLEYPKRCFFFAENAPFIGQPGVIQLGLSSSGKDNLPTRHYLIEENTLATIFRRRDRFAHKGQFGHGLLIAGSQGKMGAAILASKAALRSGIGKLSCHIPYRGETALQAAVPEAMLDLDVNSNITTMVDNLRQYDVIAIGPGLGQEEETAEMLIDLFSNASDKTFVIDADALNLIARHKSLLDLVPKGSILTPHAGEFDRLTTHWDTDEERLEQATYFARTHGLNIILKGAYSTTCTPAGSIYFNSKGNPGMATAGSGDVLTGIILALLAQGYDPSTAAVLANYFHGEAGDLFAARSSETALIASDIIDNLPEVFKSFEDR